MSYTHVPFACLFFPLFCIHVHLDNRSSEKLKTQWQRVITHITLDETVATHLSEVWQL